MLTTPDTMRALRAREGWSQYRLAEHLGVTSQAVSRWESGARTIPQTINILAAILVRSAPARRLAQRITKK